MGLAHRVTRLALDVLPLTVPGIEIGQPADGRCAPAGIEDAWSSADRAVFVAVALVECDRVAQQVGELANATGVGFGEPGEASGRLTQVGRESRSLGRRRRLPGRQRAQDADGVESWRPGHRRRR